MTRRITVLTAAVLVALALTVTLLAKGRTPLPPAEDFGPGPRTSAKGLYIATLKDADVLAPRKLLTLRASVVDAITREPIPDATITIDGGMPQHGHGLPTRPRVTKSFGDGTYEISGVRFNMGGWWEFKLTVTTPAGTDTVTFNLKIESLVASFRRDQWSAEENEQIQSLSLARLEPVPADPSNRFADDARAATLGQELFFDTRLSSNGKVSCATCHLPQRGFQDDKPLANGVGVTARRTMPIAATAHAPFLFWDGRKDSLWSQALGPLESPVEHGGSREQYARVIASFYRDEYEQLFGSLPDLTQRDGSTAVFVNIGKSIAAYERKIAFAPSRFDRYAAALATNGSAPKGVLSADEVAGLKLFIGKANCTQCHNGPLLTNNEFHNTGVASGANTEIDRGRMNGARAVLADEFNCRSKWSDAKPEQCAELEFLVTDAPELERAFKVPSLRNVADRAPYMHAGQIATLGEVVDHYNRAPLAPSGHSEVKPLNLDAHQVRQLTAFLRTLNGGIIAPQ